MIEEKVCKDCGQEYEPYGEEGLCDPCKEK